MSDPVLPDPELDAALAALAPDIDRDASRTLFDHRRRERRTRRHASLVVLAAAAALVLLVGVVAAGRSGGDVGLTTDAPAPTAAPENSLALEATWAWTSRPRTISHGPVRPWMSVRVSVMTPH